MQKRQNIFSSPQVRMNRQVELNLVTPQTVPPPEALKEQQSQQQLLSEKSPENKDDKFKDQVRPSSKPNIRYVKSSYSQPRGIQAQSLQPSNLKQYLGNGGQNQIATPISAATITNGSNGTIILSRSSLQSPPRSNPKYSLAQQPILAHKNYQRCCPSHSDECLKRICSIPYCNKDILLCGDCMYEDPDHTKIHQQDIILVNDFLDVVEKEGNKHNWKTLIEKQKEAFSTNTQNLAHFPEKHAKEYGEYIEAQKNKIHYDLEIITQMFTKYIKDIEKELIEALNSQLQYVCQQLETLRMEVFNIQDLDQKVYINPRGYLEYQLQVNQNMQEVSQHFRCIRDILFGQQITVESQRARVQNLEQLGAQLANQLKKPPNYTQLSKESLQEIEKRMVQIAANATSEIRFSIAKDTTLLTQNDQSFKSKLQNFLKSEIKTESSPTYKSHFTSFGLGTGQNSVEQLKENNRQLQQSSLNPLHLSSVESSIQQYNKEYLINRILDSNHKEDNAYNLHAKQNNLKQSQQEYDYNKKQSKVITFAGDGSSVDYTTFNIQSEEKVKNSSQNKNFQKTLAKDEEVNQNNNHQNRINNFQDKNQLNYNNKYNQSLKTPQPKENYNRSMDSNPNQIFSNIDELEAITPLQSVTPQKSNSSNWYDYQPQQPSLLNQTLSTQGKHTSSQQSMPTQQINIQSQQSTWQQMQTNLDTIPELNQSSSVNSLFAQQLSNTSHPLQDIEIMEGSKSVRIKTRNNNSISLTQIPKEIELKQDKVNCLCVVGGALIACGDSKGCIKLYNLSTQTCIGEYGAHKQSISCISPFQADQPYILSGSTGDNLIHLWNIIDEKQNIVLKDYSNQPSSQTSIKSSQSLNINFVSSLFDERNIISVVNNFSIISVWDTKDKKKIQNIKPIIQQGDTSASQVTSILSMGKQMQSILIGFKCCKVGIFKIDYENSKNYQDQNKIKQISLLKSVDLGKGNVPSNLVNLFNSKVFITIKKSVLVWDTKSFELSEKIESYLNDSNIQDICDILVIQYADANSYSVIQVSKNDNRIILQNKNQAATKHHMKDFKIVDSLFKEKLQFCKSHNNELFIVGLNQNKNTLIYWKMFDSL